MTDYPWPLVSECFSSAQPDHPCRQCDGSHVHQWIAGEFADPAAGIAVRCRICGARKCDRAECILRRHHKGHHLDADVGLPDLGDLDAIDSWLREDPGSAMRWE